MYTVGVSREFVAQHVLIVPDPGPEGEVHSHSYELDVRLRGSSLNEHGYLLDIDALFDAVEDLVDRYRDEILNDLPEFEGLNPSVEHFARIVCERLSDRLDAPHVETARVKLWEDDVAWAAYEPESECTSAW